MLLQPGDLFSRLPTQDISELVRAKNDKFWVIPIREYPKVVKKQIEEVAGISEPSKIYLKTLVDFMEGSANQQQVENTYNNSGKQIEEKKIITDFGEILGPLFAIKYLKGHKVDNVVFPTRQNYEVFDFFISNKHHYGFSSKALTGGSNTLAPKLIHERINKMKGDPVFRNNQKELEVIQKLTDHGMFEGVILAFESLINNNATARGFDISALDLKKMFAGVDFKKDSVIIEKNKDKQISSINLSKPEAYATFLTRFVLDSTKVPQSEKQKLKTGKASFTTTNIVYGFIKFISSNQFDFDNIMKHCFQDLNIVKMGIKNGVPQFVMQSMVPAEDTVTHDNFAFRSKAAFDRVRDKVGIQL